MCRVADFVEMCDELFKLVLLEANAHVEAVIGRGSAVELPSAGHLDPGMFDLKVVPSLDQGFCSYELDEGEDEEGRPPHCEARFEASESAAMLIFIVKANMIKYGR